MRRRDYRGRIEQPGGGPSTVMRGSSRLMRAGLGGSKCRGRYLGRPFSAALPIRWCQGEMGSRRPADTAAGNSIRRDGEARQSGCTVVWSVACRFSVGRFGSPSTEGDGRSGLGTRALSKRGEPRLETFKTWVVAWREVASATAGGLDATIIEDQRNTLENRPGKRGHSTFSRGKSLTAQTQARGKKWNVLFL